MKKSKLDYSATEAEVFVVRVERGVCQSPAFSANGLQKGRTVTPDSGVFDDWDD